MIEKHLVYRKIFIIPKGYYYAKGLDNLLHGTLKVGIHWQFEDLLAKMLVILI